MDSLLSSWRECLKLGSAAAAAKTADPARDAKACSRCERWRDSDLQTCACVPQGAETEAAAPIVRFMLDHIDLLDRPASDDTSAPSATPALPISIACVPCGPASSGGGLFHSDLGVAICADNVKDHETFTDELTHSLINAWDHRRFVVDWRNLRHIACAHVRLRLCSS